MTVDLDKLESLLNEAWTERSMQLQGMDAPEEARHALREALWDNAPDLIPELRAARSRAAILEAALRALASPALLADVEAIEAAGRKITITATPRDVRQVVDALAGKATAPETEWCVVCGDGLIPRPPPHCEGCDPEEAGRDSEPGKLKET